MYRIFLRDKDDYISLAWTLAPPTSLLLSWWVCEDEPNNTHAAAPPSALIDNRGVALTWDWRFRQACSEANAAGVIKTCRWINRFRGCIIKLAFTYSMFAPVQLSSVAQTHLNHKCINSPTECIYAFIKFLLFIILNYTFRDLKPKKKQEFSSADTAARKPVHYTSFY